MKRFSLQNLENMLEFSSKLYHNVILFFTLWVYEPNQILCTPSSPILWPTAMKSSEKYLIFLAYDLKGGWRDFARFLRPERGKCVIDFVEIW